MKPVTGRLPGLDLLRAIAIVWVMLFHSWIVGGFGVDHPWLGRIAQTGWMGVDLFFVLSGYLIGSQLLNGLSRGQPLALAEFYRRRAFRVLPAYLAVLALYFLWPGFREAPGIQPLWQFLTFSVNLSIDYGSNRAFSHVWSLCVEEHFYLFFPLIAWWLARRPSPTTFIAAAIGVLLFGIAIRGVLWHNELASARGIEGLARGFGQRFIEDIYFPTWTRLDGLLCGVVLATIRAYRPTWWSRIEARANTWMVLGLTITALALALFQDRTGFVATLVGYPLLSIGLALLVAAGASHTGWLATIVVPGAGWFAATSYSLYLIHKAVYAWVQRDLLPALDVPGAAAFILYALATLAAGALLHYGVERPFVRLRDRGRETGTPDVPALETAGGA